MVDRSAARRAFRAINAAAFFVYALACLLPLVYVLSLSLSSSVAVTAGRVKLFPVDFTLKSYEYVLKRPEFWQAMLVSFERILLGVSFSTLMTVLAAYPLSRRRKDFRARPVFSWLFVFTMLFSGGLIPTYMIVRGTGLIDTIWALVFPGAVQVFNILLLMNYFKTVPREIEESAFMDGASHWHLLLRIYLPMSMPSLATIVIFSVVGNWNSWFDGLIYMNKTSNYPMQTYLQSILVTPRFNMITKQTAELMRYISDRTLKAAQVFIATIPVFAFYPFLQRYFISGIMLGGVKE